jgi:hypothetical protein
MRKDGDGIDGDVGMEGQAQEQAGETGAGELIKEIQVWGKDGVEPRNS